MSMGKDRLDQIGKQFQESVSSLADNIKAMQNDLRAMTADVNEMRHAQQKQRACAKCAAHSAPCSQIDCEFHSPDAPKR